VADDSNERARRLAIPVGLVLVSAGLTHFFVQRDADARVLDVETHQATRLAECEEGAATRRLELEGRVAACELERAHASGGTTGDRVGHTHVVAVSGRSDLHAGDACDVELDWNSDPLEGCRALVRCGAVRLYGDLGTGFFACTVDDEGIVHGEDSEPSAGTEGDARLVIDRAEAELTISDEGAGAVWSVTLSLPLET